MFLVTHFARGWWNFSPRKAFRQDVLPLKIRQSFGYNSLFIDRMKRFGARLVLMISTGKRFAGDNGNAWVETWFKEKHYWKHDGHLNIQLTVGIFSNATAILAKP